MSSLRPSRSACHWLTARWMRQRAALAAGEARAGRAPSSPAPARCRALAGAPSPRGGQLGLGATTGIALGSGDCSTSSMSWRFRSPCASARKCVSTIRRSWIRAHPQWAILPHGLNNNTAGHRGLSRDAERTLIDGTVALMRQAFGMLLRGFMIPNWSTTEDTFDLLHEAGVRYTTDWMNDDQPYWYTLAGGRLLNIPYNLETNDYTLVLTARLSGPELARAVMAMDGGQDARPVDGHRHPLVHLRTTIKVEVRPAVSHPHEEPGGCVADNSRRHSRRVRASRCSVPSITSR
jgi:peptidoglycan/xylan/chitin deacetylase (PgdA/CDA1 family)